jgi:hypothetical protein
MRLGWRGDETARADLAATTAATRSRRWQERAASRDEIAV